MDNISHAVFGSSIIHALWGKKYGNRPAIYALLASNIPDIDIVVRAIPWVNALRASLFHRTMTHSLLFVLILAPMLWWCVSRFMIWSQKRAKRKILTQKWETWDHGWKDTTFEDSKRADHYIQSDHKKSLIARKDWTLITLVALLSHIFLDWCTTYGVWLLWPFVDFGFEANIIAVVDMFFTLPLLAIIIRYIIAHKTPEKASTKRRFLWVWFAACYLIAMTWVQQYFKHSIKTDMKQQWVSYTRVFVWAQILQPFLRYGIVELPDGSYKLTYRSVFDTTKAPYENVYGYHELLAWREAKIPSSEFTNFMDSLMPKKPLIEKLITRAHGWYQVTQTPTWLLLQDMRFGRILGRDNAYRGAWMFAYNIDSTTWMLTEWSWNRSFNQPLSLIWQKYWQRVWGQ